MTKAKTTVSLVGKFGLSFLDDNTPQFQFQVAGLMANGDYLLQLYSWVMGDPSDQQLVPEGWFAEHRVKFFDDADEWRARGEPWLNPRVG